MSENPLQKLFRTKSFYLALPSGGNFYPSGITLSVDNELGIMPMTIKDEITLKSPDILFNGEALYALFLSCVPDIINPREIPQCDVDAILVGIRMAAGKKNIEVSSACPTCKVEAEYELSLGKMLNSITPMNDDNVITLENGTVINVRPYSLESQVKTKVQTFHQYRMQQLLNSSDVDQEGKDAAFADAMASASIIQISLVADNIISVNIDDETAVTDPAHILEWVKNMDNETYKSIISKIAGLSSNTMDSTFDVECQDCQHKYKTVVDIDPVNFF
jgi:hypothetical protein